MKLFLICLELNQRYCGYKGLTAFIKGCGKWWRYIDNLWIVKTSSGISEITNAIRSHILDSDHFFVCDISNSDRNGWLNSSAWEWLSENDTAEEKSGGEASCMNVKDDTKSSS